MELDLDIPYGTKVRYINQFGYPLRIHITCNDELSQKELMEEFLRCVKQNNPELLEKNK